MESALRMLAWSARNAALRAFARAGGGRLHVAETTLLPRGPASAEIGDCRESRESGQKQQQRRPLNFRFHGHFPPGRASKAASRCAGQINNCKSHVRSKEKARGPVSRVLSTSLRWMGDHSSRTGLAPGLQQSTRTTGRSSPCAVPIRSCSRWGLPCRSRCRARGALLPHPFGLARNRQKNLEGPPGGLLSVALSLGSPPPGVTRHRYSLEPGLSSPHRINDARRPPGPLAPGRLGAFPSGLKCKPGC